MNKIRKRKQHQCCEYCFVQENIQEYIRKMERKGKCNYCYKEDVAVAFSGDVGAFIREKLDIAYINVNEITGSTHDDKEMDSCENRQVEGKSIRELLSDVFGEGTDRENLLSDLLSDSSMNTGSDKEDKFVNWHTDKFILRNALHQIESPSDIFLKQLNDPTSGYNIWNEFKYLIKSYNRYFDVNPNVKKREDLLNSLTPYFEKMIAVLPKGKQFYRVRIMSEEDFYNFDKLDMYREMSPPPPEKVKENRMSPAGISYLYVAEEDDTAYKECRVNSYDKVFIAEFTSKKELSVLDLTQKLSSDVPSIFSKEYDEYIPWASDFISSFEYEISQPVGSGMETSQEYLATQILAEYVRSKGYDGIKYRSSLGEDGNCYVFFCGPNSMISKTFIPGYQYQELIYFTDWFEITSVKAVNIAVTIVPLTQKEKTDIIRSDISAENIFEKYEGSFTYSSYNDIEQFIKDIPKLLENMWFDMEVSKEIINHMKNSLKDAEGVCHEFAYLADGFSLKIQLDGKKYEYFNKYSEPR